MKLLYKIALIAVVSSMIICFSYQFFKYSELRNKTGEAYFNTVNFLNNEVDSLEVYIEELDKYKSGRTEDYVRFLTFLNGQLSGIVMEFQNVPQKIPMKKNHYEFMYSAIMSDISALINIANKTVTWIDEAYVRNRIIATCKKLQWSFKIIMENANKYQGKYGYYKELYFLNSNTHKTIDNELYVFLKEVHKINVH